MRDLIQFKTLQTLKKLSKKGSSSSSSSETGSTSKPLRHLKDYEKLKRHVKRRARKITLDYILEWQEGLMAEPTGGSATGGRAGAPPDLPKYRAATDMKSLPVPLRIVTAVLHRMKLLASWREPMAEVRRSSASSPDRSLRISTAFHTVCACHCVIAGPSFE